VTFTLSPPVRYAALLGLLAAVLVGGGMTMLGRGHSSAAPTHVINRHPFGTHVKKHATAPKNQHAAVTARPKAAASAKPKAAAAPAAPAVKNPPRTPAATKAALAAGLPARVAVALGTHDVVVVSLFNPYSKVDAISFAEARAGAKLAGVGFVSLDVLSKAQVEKLTEELGLLPDPGVLVYVRPARLAGRISGFADKETVAQAAQNAARGA
jgi:hypothetical protein